MSIEKPQLKFIHNPINKFVLLQKPEADRSSPTWADLKLFTRKIPTCVILFKIYHARYNQLAQK